MSFQQQPTWTRPDSARPAPTPVAQPGGLAPASQLLTGAADPRVESRRIALGLVVLAVLSIVLLNFGILSGARERLARERWAQISATLEAKREEVRELLWQFEHQSEFVAGQPQIAAWIRAAQAADSPPADVAALSDELARAARSFDYRSIRVVARDGRVLGSGSGSLAPLSAEEHALALEALADQRSRMNDVHHPSASQQSMMLAVPVPGEDLGAVVLFEGNLEDALLPVLMSWPGFGADAGAYLVKRDGDDVVFVTSPPADLEIVAGERAPMNRDRMLPAAMAVEGVESNTESVDAKGRPLWAVTRGLAERNWGIVAQVDRASAMAGMRGTLFGLLAIDMAMLILAVAGIWYWRRQYRTGLAQRETEVTRRHAGRIQSIFDTAFDAILTFNRDGRIVTVNRAGAALFGRAADAMEGEPFQRFLQCEGLAGGMQGTSLLTGTVLRAEALRADGALVPVEFSLGSAGEGDELIYTAIVRDVTERVEAEKRIQTFAQGLEQSNARLEEVNAQLEEASRLKSEFLANTSHELRTPLNGMIGFLQLVLDGLCDSKDEERDFLQKALHCSRHLLGLINDVLDIAKIEAGKLTLELARVDVGQLFDEVYMVTHVQAAQKGVKIRFEPPPGDAPGVRGDFGKIKQVLINLVGNSLKFTPSGTITVRASAHPEPGHYIFEVVDTGIGIPPERQQAIFEKFIQGDGSTTRKYGGTGLGLAITRSLVELMGGIIGVHSEGAGKGTRMYFSLPIWRHEAEHGALEEVPNDQIAGPQGGPLVLVVEDDGMFRHYLTALLHGHGYRTVEARHAEGGWALARRLRPAVVVTDYALTCPEGATIRTGCDLAERMTSDALTRHIPMIFVTGFDQELREKLKGTAFARRPEHLVKPIEGSVLVDRIQEMVGSIQNRVIRVLMADDDPSVAAYIRKVLPLDRFHVEVTNNGDECLHALRTQPKGFDLLLLDLMMPEVSGYDVLREMTLTGLSSSLPVLVLTNYPEPRNEEERRLLEQGLVMEVVPKATVHDNPQLLAHVIDWQLQMILEGGPGRAEDPPEEQRAAA
jgi:PAS domain S-box-containing protein